MKTYEVTRSTSGQVGVLVKTGNRCDATLLRHCVVHSPTGFETGYGGSGSADLALSILADYLGAMPEKVIDTWRNSWGLGTDSASKAIRLHQLFKSRFIAGRHLDAGGSYEILGAEIASWLGDVEKPKVEVNT